MTREHITFGVANSICADSGFDPVRTIRWAARHGFNTVQVYLKMHDTGRRTVESLIDTAAQTGVSLIFHAPAFDLFDPVRRGIYLDALSSIPEECCHWNRRLIVWHIHPLRTVAAHLEVHDALLKAGFLSAPENHPAETTVSALPAAMKLFRDIWAFDDVVPVLDLPRFFALSPEKGPEWSREVLDAAAGPSRRILHVIDSGEPVSDRKRWCPVGDGICAWRELWGEIRRWRKTQLIIFEYESRAPVLLSRRRMSVDFQD